MTFSVGQAQPTGLDTILSGALSGVSQGLQESLESFHKNKQLDKEAKSLAPLLEQTGLNVDENALKDLLGQGLGAKDILGFGTEFSKIQGAQRQAEEKQVAEEKKIVAAQEEKLAMGKQVKGNLDTLKDLIPYTGTTKIPFTKAAGSGGPLPVNRQAFQNRKKFDKLGFWVTDKIFTHFNKGVINKPKFEEIKTELAPRADLTQRENAARIDAMEEILALPKDISAEQFDAVYESVKDNMKNSSGKDVNPADFWTK